MSKALDLFPSLTEEDLKPYLLRSRATNAYDAVTLLARSVGVAFNQHRDEGSCPGIEQVQTALERNMVSCVAHSTCRDLGDSNTMQLKVNSIQGIHVRISFSF
jgi:hypothetical protein